MKPHLFMCIACVIICIAAAPVSAMQPLVVEMTHTPDPVHLGETISYTITFTNPNADSVHNIEINADLTGGATPQWSAGSLPAGATASVDWTSTISAIAPGFYLDSVTVCSDETGAITIFRETAVIPADPILLDITDSLDPVCQGDSSIFTITYGNPNSFPLTAVCITGFLPDGLDFLSCTCSGIYDGLFNTVQWFIGTINGGYTGMVSFCGVVSPSSPDGEELSTLVCVRSDEAGVQNGVTETTTVEDPLPVPEFPSPAAPAAMLAGCIAACAAACRRL